MDVRSAAAELQRDQPISRPKLGLILWVAGVMLAIACRPLLAEEQVQASSEQPDSSIYFSLSAHRSPFRLSQGLESTRLKIGELFPASDEWWLSSTLRSLKLDEVVGPDYPVTLFRKPMATPYSYRGWAGLGTGYGQLLSTGTFGRSRTNGVGVQDPGFLYLKMSLRF